MNIGLNILENVRISIGDSTNNIINKLKNSGINYKIISNKFNTIDNYVIYIDKYGLEINSENDNIIMIKIVNSNLNRLITVDSNNPIEMLNKIKNKIKELFDIQDERLINIYRFNSISSSSVVTIPYNENSNVTLNLVRGYDDAIYIEKIKVVKK
ncbi:MAG: hypothetical protein IJ593_12430 [Lachnospiraceae bacterium]|nr:hypothetical protein [Lachnospiraceae bacterium]